MEVSVVPMSRHLPNVLDLPIVSSFVQSSIAAAANEYVAPKVSPHLLPTSTFGAADVERKKITDEYACFFLRHTCWYRQSMTCE